MKFNYFHVLYATTQKAKKWKHDWNKVTRPWVLTLKDGIYNVNFPRGSMKDKLKTIRTGWFRNISAFYDENLVVTEIILSHHLIVSRLEAECQFHLCNNGQEHLLF